VTTSGVPTTIAWVTVPPRSAPPFTATLPVPSYTLPDETFAPDTGPPPPTFAPDAELPDYEWRVNDEMIVRMATPDNFRQHPYGNHRVNEQDRQQGLYALERWLVLHDAASTATFAIQSNFGRTGRRLRCRSTARASLRVISPGTSGMERRSRMSALLPTWAWRWSASTR
jgi:hypothetical protein